MTNEQKTISKVFGLLILALTAVMVISVVVMLVLGARFVPVMAAPLFSWSSERWCTGPKGSPHKRSSHVADWAVWARVARGRRSRRCSGRPGRRRTVGLWSGAGCGSGRSSTGWCWTSSVRMVS